MGSGLDRTEWRQRKALKLKLEFPEKLSPFDRHRPRWPPETRPDVKEGRGEGDVRVAEEGDEITYPLATTAKHDELASTAPKRVHRRAVATEKQ